MSADVAILGAGFTGLWTAYYVLKRDPSRRVVLLEAEIAGFGASGRNGGWCYSGFPVPPRRLQERYGTETARSILLQMYESVNEVGRVCQEERIDAHYAKTGALTIARAQHHLPVLQERYEAYRQLGLEQHYALLDAKQTEEHLRVARAVGALLIKEGATIQPARLARGLARVVERLGATLYEQTRVLRVVPGRPARLVTEQGDVTAPVVVVAGEAYLASIPGFRRTLLPLTSHIVLTEPLDPACWQQIGWERREVVDSLGPLAGYLNKTADGRIAFGAYRSVYPFGSRIRDELDRQEGIFAHARTAACDWFPQLSGKRFTHAWGGVFGVPRDRMPTMSFNPQTGIACGFGYTGQGVATANLTGRVLADLITGTESELTALPMTTHRPRLWEPEPLRWLGVTLVRRSLARLERRAEQTGRYPAKPTLAQRLWQS
jgi:glycine/D-amino acid oxidase-like deaminating enzyme